MDPSAHHCAATGYGPQRRRHQAPHRGEDDGGVERLWRRGLRPARPLDAERAGEPLGILISRSGEGEYAPSLVARDLGHDVRRRAEAVQTEPHGVARRDQGAVPDEAGAQ